LLILKGADFQGFHPLSARKAGFMGGVESLEKSTYSSFWTAFPVYRFF